MKLFSIIFIISWHPIVSSTEENFQKRPCQRSLAIPLPNEEIHHFENDSLLHDGLIYPPNLYWHDENATYGCTCELLNCVRKCCQNGQVLSAEKSPVCLSKNYSLPELAPEKHQLAEEIKNLSKVSDRFGIVKNRLCPGKAYKLEPESIDEDKFVLQSDGSLMTTDEHFKQSRFCMDLHEDLMTITVLVCHEPEVEVVTPQTTIYPIGITISIPFLMATLIVYAIIPELKNLYGMTLMCYVASLAGAYCFLTGGRFVDHGQSLCVIIAFLRVVRGPQSTHDVAVATVPIHVYILGKSAPMFAHSYAPNSSVRSHAIVVFNEDSQCIAYLWLCKALATLTPIQRSIYDPAANTEATYVTEVNRSCN